MCYTSERHGQPKATKGLVLLAFAAVYLVWGSTYLGIHFAVETLPPFLMGGVRFLCSGLILYGWLRGTGTPAPTRLQWRNAGIAGALLLGLGNGGVNWAEQKVPSGLTSLLIAGTPVWFALLDWLRPGGTRPTIQALIGIAVGFAGVAMLVGSRKGLAGGPVDVAGGAALMIASIAWAGGSLFSKYASRPASPLMSAAQQMILGGVVLLLIGLVLGEGARFAWSRVAARSVWALVYLTLVGSLIGFTTYAWLLRVSTPVRVSTYAYVNPVIAVFLGWAFGGETLTARMLIAAAVIILGVAIITSRKSMAATAVPNRRRPKTSPVPLSTER